MELDKTIYNFFKALVVLIPLVAGFELSAEIFTFTLDPVILKSNLGIILVSGMFLFFTIKVIAKKRTIFYSSELTPVILFLILSFGYIFKSINVYSAVHIFNLYLSYFFVYFLSLNIYRDNASFKDLLIVLIKVKFVLVIIGILQIYFPEKITFINQFAPPSGTFGNRNFFGQFLVFLFPISIYFLLRGKKIERIISFVNIVFTIDIVNQINAKQLYLILFLLATFYIVYQFIFYFKNKKFQLSKAKDIAILTAVLIMSLILLRDSKVAIGTEFLQADQGTATTPELFDFGRKDDWSSGRYQMIVNSLDMIKDHPYGVGLGQWEIYYIFYQDRHLKDTAFDHRARSRELHNEYIEILLNLSFLGFLLVFTAFVILSFKILPSLFKEEKNTELYLFICLSILVFILVAGVSKPINAYVLPFFTVLFSGFLSANCNLPNKSKEYKFSNYTVYVVIALVSVNMLYVSYKYIPNLYAKYIEGKVWLTPNRKNLNNQEYLYLKSMEIEPGDPQTIFDTGLILTKQSKYKRK